MSLSTVIRNTIGLGEPASPDEDATRAAALREQRVLAARANRDWTEIEETALVRRGPFLVHAPDDRVFTIHRGQVFAPKGARVEFGEKTPLSFYVDDDLGVVMLERYGSQTWSEHCERQARRQARAAS